MDAYANQKSFILLVDDCKEAFEACKSKLHRAGTETYRAHYNELFALEDAHEVVRLAYLHHDFPIWMIVGARSYNEYAQNRLLKVLEEPPSGVLFVLIALNKSAFLPTILSRLYVVDERSKRQLDPFPIQLDRMRLPDVYEFLKELLKKYPNKEENKELIAALLFEVKRSGVALSAEDLDCFNKAIVLAEQFERAEHIFAPLLLRILKRTQGVGGMGATCLRMP